MHITVLPRERVGFVTSLDRPDFAEVRRGDAVISVIHAGLTDQPAGAVTLG